MDSRVRGNDIRLVAPFSNEHDVIPAKAGIHLSLADHEMGVEAASETVATVS
jgi:hypothetical protein